MKKQNRLCAKAWLYCVSNSWTKAIAFCSIPLAEGNARRAYTKAIASYLPIKR